MSKICFIPRKFGAPTMEIIERANAIFAKYLSLGYEMTLRQAYYQMIAKDYFPDSWIDVAYNRKHGLPDDTKNTQKNYDRFGEILNAARLGGVVDWGSLSDITRNLKGLPHWSKPQDIIDSAAEQFRIDKWKTQPNYIEVWVEKDALINIMEKVANELDISYFSCRGYTSQSEMFAAGRRLKRKIAGGKKPIVLHFGDHDPSGFDMSRDIEERLTMFAETPVELKRVALNMDQIRQLNAPPNPAKITDLRAKNYIKRFGNESWELDAIEPPEMAQLVRDEINLYLDVPAWEKAVELETESRKSLQLISERFKDAVVFLGGNFSDELEIFAEEKETEETPDCPRCSSSIDVTESGGDEFYCSDCDFYFSPSDNYDDDDETEED